MRTHLPSWTPSIGLALAFALVSSFPGPAHATWVESGNRITPFTLPMTNPDVLGDGHGGAFAVLDGFFSGPLLRRLDPDGASAPGWGAVATPCALGAGVQAGVSRMARLLPDRRGGTFVVWFQSGEFCSHGCSYNEPGRLRVQRMNGNGSRAAGWPEAGFVLSEHPTSALTGFDACDDGSGGAWVTWNGFVTHVSADGPDPRTRDLVLSNEASTRTLPAIASDGRGGAYVFWGQTTPGSFGNRLFGQHLSACGELTWGAAGRAVSRRRYAMDASAPSVSTLPGGDAIVAWSGVLTNDADIFASRVDRHGRQVWRRDAQVCGAAGVQHDPRVVNTGGGSVLVGWLDPRPEAGVFVQGLDARGRTRLRPGGSAVAADASDRISLAMCSDGQGGAFVAWGERASAYALYATRIDARGRTSGGWPEAPVPIATRTAPLTESGGSYSQIASLQLSESGRASAVLGWQEYRLPETAPNAGWSELSLLMRLGPAGPAATPAGARPEPAASGGSPQVAARFSLSPVFPNPSRGEATVRFVLADDSPASLEVFDVLGRRLSQRTFEHAAGEHHLALGAEARLPAGMYLVRLRQAGRVATSRVIVTR